MLVLPLSLLAAHFIGDFALQSNNMALRKSTSNEWLTKHVLTYSTCFLPWGLGFASLTFVLHWIVDYFTSRCTSKLWFIKLDEPDLGGYGIDHYRWATVYKYRRHWFFIMIGVDQLIHFICLALTYKLFFGA